MAKSIDEIKEDNKSVISTFLIVDNISNDDNSIVRLSEQKMNELELFDGDIVLLRSKSFNQTLSIVFSDETCSNDHIRMNHIVQYNLHVYPNDIILIESCQNIKHGKCIHIVPIDDSIQEIGENFLEIYLKPYFSGNYHPIMKGDIFIIHVNMKDIEFRVVKTDPSPYCIVVSDTIIHCEDEETSLDEISFDDIGGLENIKPELIDIFECSHNSDEVCRISSRAILLHGPPGCGKTLLVKALANECKVNFIRVILIELLSISSTELEVKINNIFDKARQNKQCILFFDGLDSIAEFRNGSTSDRDIITDQILNKILIGMETMIGNRNVLIIGATNRPDILDKSVFEYNHFSNIIYIPLPDEKSRLSILKIALRKSSVSKNVDIKYLSTVTNGFSGADLSEICQRACKSVIRELIEKEEQSKKQTIIDTNKSDFIPEIRQDHFEQALKFARRSVSDNDIRLYEKFAQTYDQQRAFSTQFRFPERQTLHGNCEDDDLYN